MYCWLLMWKMKNHQDTTLCVCYGSMALFITMLHNVFLLYHVETFVSIYKIDKKSFWIGEAIFLVWNSCNDPLFGWVSDKKKLLGKGTEDIVLKRLKAIGYSGPLFAIAFFSFWISWTYPNLQFVICLCAYDGFLTMVDLHHNSLLADLAVSAHTRMRLNSYCAIFGIFGSLSVFLSYYVWSLKYFQTFQEFCALLALVSLLGFAFTSKYMVMIHQHQQKQKCSRLATDVFSINFN